MTSRDFDPGCAVVDACIGVKWLLTEEHSDKALDLLTSGATLIVPDFFFAEVANTLWKRTRYSDAALRVDSADAEALIRLLLRIPLVVELSRNRIWEALALSNELGCAVYDAIYVLLAQERRCRCITSDDSLLRRIQGSRAAPWVYRIGALD
jgi:predicted nucleic acid-binding protein